MMEQSGDADEFLEHAKLEMFSDQVFTFTPKGDLISLPRGATPLDFAYAVHTKIGDTCIGAVINGREVPLRSRLKNGDAVKIIRGGQAEAQQDWENMVVTGKARSALRRLTRTGELAEFRRIGQMLADHAFSREDKDFSESSLIDAMKRLNYSSILDLYEMLGRGKLSIQDFMNSVFPARKSSGSLETIISRDLINDNTAKLYVKGEGLRSGVSIHLSSCCYPVPGDRIVGYQSEGRGVDVHTIDCDVLEKFEIQQEKWLDLGWRRAALQTASTGRITATLEHVPGSLADVTKIVGEAGGNVTNIKTLVRSQSFFDMEIDIEVSDNRHLLQIVAAMRASTYVVAAERTRSETMNENEKNYVYR
jgi:GTP pyrophosphokinase/guanosine-3',5'-bis(diphosphate) 3'-pyrophosphohydrolase